MPKRSRSTRSKAATEHFFLLHFRFHSQLRLSRTHYFSFTLVYVRWLTFCLVFCLRKNFELVCACSAESFTKLSPLDTDHERFTKSIISLLLALFAPLEWSRRVLHKRRTRSLIVQIAKLVAYTPNSKITSGFRWLQLIFELNATNWFELGNIF